MKQLFFLISLMFVLTGCSTFSKEQCTDMNWQKAGEHSALDGNSLKQGEQYYSRECFSEHGVNPDYAAFKVGYDDGLKKFCTPEYSYQFATKGGMYTGTCPKELEPKIAEKFNSGRVVFLEKEVLRLKTENESLEGEVSRLQGEVSTLQSDSNTCTP